MSSFDLPNLSPHDLPRFPSVLDVLGQILGRPGYVEQTGGGCEALVVDSPNGWTVVATWEANVPEWGQEDVALSVYGPGDWHNEEQGTIGGGDPVAHVDLIDPLMPHVLAAGLSSVINTAALRAEQVTR